MTHVSRERDDEAEQGPRKIGQPKHLLRSVFLSQNSTWNLRQPVQPEIRPQNKSLLLLIPGESLGCFRL